MPAKKTNKLAVIFSANLQYAKELAAMGFDIVCYTSDSALLQEAANNAIGIRD
jgi:2-keto-3-deoxy-L-rhamnonate aldolase RhmA